MAVRLTVHNYRVLKDIDWTPSGVCLLVGPNGSGKTTLLSVLELLRGSFQYSLAPAIEYIGGAACLKNIWVPEEARISFGVGVAGHDWRMDIAASGASVDERPGESLFSDKQPILRRPLFSDTFSYEGRDIACQAQLALRAASDLRLDRIPEALIYQLRNFRVYHSYNLFQLRKTGSLSTSDHFLHPSGMNAFSVLRNWRDKRESMEKYRFVLDMLRLAFPAMCEDIEFEVAGQTTSIRLWLPKASVAIPVVFASNGWLSALLHLVAIAGAAPGSLVAIDEFENSLHPFAVRCLIQAFRQWASRFDITVVLAGHSLALLDEFKEQPENIFVMQSGVAPLPARLTSLAERDWLSQFSLGDLYRHEDFGGPVVTTSQK